MWFLRRTVPVMGAAVLLVAFSFTPSLFALEPLNVSIDVSRDEPAIEMPDEIWSGLESRITEIVHSLRRFDVGSSTDVPAPTHELRFRVVSYRETGVPGADGIVEARMVLAAGVFERHGETPIKMFTLAFVQSGDTRDELYKTFPHHSNTRIVRQWSTREAGGIARELVDGVVEFGIDGGVDFPPAGVRPRSKSRVPTGTTSLQLVVNPYAPLFFGGGLNQR